MLKSANVQIRECSPTTKIGSRRWLACVEIPQVVIPLGVNQGIRFPFATIATIAWQNVKLRGQIDR